MRNSFIVLSDCIQFFAPFIICLGLLLTLPKDLAGVSNIKENSQKAEIKIQIKSFFKKQSWMAKTSSVREVSFFTGRGAPENWGGGSGTIS